jgi:hypothetical protein
VLNLDPVLVLSVLLPLNVAGLAAYVLAARQVRAAESRRRRRSFAARAVAHDRLHED